ncbi:hypothetical protein, partial [Siminovitchia fortis]|uniref:hypothetical protein n=1 Tax=Siminovitchia fortis TaxID=254758 RepID=UPI0011A18682
MKVDDEGFGKEMEKERERGGWGRRERDWMEVESGRVWELRVRSEFVGYEGVERDWVVVGILKEGEME